MVEKGALMTYDCEDQLLINKMILKNPKTKHKNLNCASIDYKKNL